MALTRVSRHIIDDPFNPTAVSATDVTTTNINASGIGTIGNLRVTGDLTVEGTTTTLDSILTEVDRLEVSANSTVAAGIITQTGSGDILNLYDGSNKEFSVEDGGTVKISQSMAFQQSDRVTTAGLLGRGSLLIAGTQQTDFAIKSNPHNSNLILGVGVTERLRITSDGRIGIGQNAPATTLEIKSDANAQTTATIPTLRITNDDGSASSNDITGSVEFFTEDTSDPNHISGFMRNLSETNAGVNYSLIFGTKSNSIDDATERLRITSAGNIGIGTDNAVAKVDIITGTGDGTQNEANCLRLRQRGINGNSMTLQVGVNPTAAGALNQGYAYLQGRFWGGGNNPILLNPKGGNVGIGQTRAYVPLDVNGDTILRTAGHTTQGDLTRKVGFTGPNATSNPHSYIAGVADQQYWYQGLGLVFGTVRGNDIGGTLGVERMRITSAGDVGIGTDNPDVYSLGGNNRYAAIKASAGYTVLNLVDSNNSGSYLQFGNSSVRRGSLHFESNSDFVITSNASNSGTTLTERLRITGFGTCRLPDNGRLTLGAGDDLQIHHNNTNSIIEHNGTGNLYIQTTGDNEDLYLQSADNVLIRPQGSEDGIRVIGNGTVELYYNNQKKFETTTTGAKVTGALEVTQEYPSIRPTLDLNFAATKTLDRRITFTRDSIGTYTDDMGILKYASNNTPRFDHDFGTGESLGLLIEESRTNLLSYSTSFNLWSSISLMSISVNNQTAPDETQTAANFIFPTNPATIPYCTQSYTFSATAHTFSVFAKYNGIQYLWLNMWDGAVSRRAIFDIQNGTLGSTQNSPSGQTITAYGNGWYRCTISATTSANTGDVSIRFANSSSDFDSDTITGNGSDGQYIWGAQLEQGSFATSYIPTSGSTVTRAADFATIKGTNFTDFYNQTEGTLFGEFTIKDIATSSAAIVNINQEPGSSYANSIMFVEIGTAAGYFGRTFKNSSGAGLSNGSNVANLLHPSTTPQTVSFGYTSVSGGELRAYWNGDYVNSSSVTSYVPTTLTNMRIGRGWGGTDTINAHIRKLSYYPKRLPDAQLQGLTQQ